MKAGLIGYGKWAKNIVASLPPDVELVAVVSNNPEVPQLVPRIPKLTDLPFNQLDAVIIANDASRHLDMLGLVRAYAPKLPVFVEKPLMMRSPAGYPLFREHFASTLGLVDHIWLFHERLLEMRRILDGVPPATILGVDEGMGPVRTDCHPLWDYGPHAVAAALYLAGFPLKSGGIHVRDAWLKQDEHGATIDLNLQIGSRTEARLRVGNNAETKSRYYTIPGTGTFDGVPPAKSPPLAAALLAFFGAVKEGKVPEGDVRFGWELPLAVTQVLADVEEVLEKRCTPIRKEAL